MTPLYIGLDAFEHDLLKEFIDVFGLSPPNELHPEDLRSSASLWLWFSMVEGDYRLVFYDDEEALNISDGYLKAWKVFLNRVSGGLYHPRFGRLTTLLAQNPSFPQCLGEQDLGTEPICHTWSRDGDAWSLVSSLVVDAMLGMVDAQNVPLCDFPANALELLSNSDQNPQVLDTHSASSEPAQPPNHSVANPDQLPHENDDQAHNSDYEDDMAGSEIEEDYEPSYEIWSLLRTCAGLRRSQHNRDKVVQFLKAGAFLNTHVPVSITGQYVCKKSLDRVGDSYSVALIPGAEGIYSLPSMMLSLLDPIRPLSVLEMISYEDLELVSPQSIELVADTAQYGCWRAKNTCKFDHHLFTEEEVFKFCVTAGWTFPGHLENGRVLFRLTPLVQSDLLNDLTELWENWNDIAITQDTDKGEWFVLETVPGRKFRTLLKENTRLAAREYFRSLANEANLGPRESLQTTLGLNFQPRFEHLLKIIPYGEIVHVDPMPIRGAHGAVFRATWARPESIGVSSAEERKVALKTVAGINSTDQQDRVFSELDLTFSATVGQVFGTIDFWGVIRTPSVMDGPTPSILHVLSPDTTILMFDFAEHGSLLSYLRMSMTETALDWDTVLGFVATAADGLSNLHKANIVHRDLHLGNVLVTERETPSDGLIDTEISVVLADFGEGKMVNLPNQAAAASLRSVGNTYIRPPEVRTYDDYTAKSDVFDFGRLLEELVVLQWRWAEVRHGKDAQRKLPLWLYEVIQHCLEIDPEKRPTSAYMSTRLNKLDEDAIASKRHDGPFELIDPETYPFQRQEATVSEDFEDVIPEG